MPLTIPGIQKNLKNFRREERVRERLLALLDLTMGVFLKRVTLELGISGRILAQRKSTYLKLGAIGLREK